MWEYNDLKNNKLFTEFAILLELTKKSKIELHNELIKIQNDYGIELKNEIYRTAKEMIISEEKADTIIKEFERMRNNPEERKTYKGNDFYFETKETFVGVYPTDFKEIYYIDEYQHEIIIILRYLWDMDMQDCIELDLMLKEFNEEIDKALKNNFTEIRFEYYMCWAKEYVLIDMINESMKDKEVQDQQGNIINLDHELLKYKCLDDLPFISYESLLSEDDYKKCKEALIIENLSSDELKIKGFKNLVMESIRKEKDFEIYWRDYLIEFNVCIDKEKLEKYVKTAISKK